MSHAKQPPQVPQVVLDEAGNSPRWLPLVGLALLALLGLLVAVRQATGSGHAKPMAKAPAAAAADSPAQAAAGRE